MKQKTSFFALAATLLFGSFTVAAQTAKPDTLSRKLSADTAIKKQTLSTGGSATDGQTIISSVEVEASVDINQWRQHLENNLMAPIVKAAKKGMRAGTYTVNVRFLVEKNGSISDVKALNDPGYGLASASEKVVKTGPRWEPGLSEGKIVRSYHTQPITFVISEK